MITIEAKDLLELSQLCKDVIDAHRAVENGRKGRFVALSYADLKLRAAVEKLEAYSMPQ